MEYRKNDKEFERMLSGYWTGTIPMTGQSHFFIASEVRILYQNIQVITLRFPYHSPSFIKLCLKNPRHINIQEKMKQCFQRISWVEEEEEDHVKGFIHEQIHMTWLRYFFRECIESYYPGCVLELHLENRDHYLISCPFHLMDLYELGYWSFQQIEGVGLKDLRVFMGLWIRCRQEDRAVHDLVEFGWSDQMFQITVDFSDTLEVEEDETRDRCRQIRSTVSQLLQELPLDKSHKLSLESEWSEDGEFFLQILDPHLLFSFHQFSLLRILTKVVDLFDHIRMGPCFDLKVLLPLSTRSSSATARRGRTFRACVNDDSPRYADPSSIEPV